MDAKDAPLSEFDSEKRDDDEVLELGAVSQETQGGPLGSFPEVGWSWYKGG